MTVKQAAMAGLSGVWRGFAAPFAGIGTIASQPRLWPFAMAPTLLLLVFLAVFGAAGVKLFRVLVQWLIPHVGGGFWGSLELIIAQALAFLVLAALAVILSVGVVPVLAAPLMEELAGRVDARTKGPESMWVGVWRGIRVSLIGLLLFLPAQIIIAVLGLAAPFLSFVWAPLGVFFAALKLAYDALDYPLARREMGVRARLDWLGDHKAVVLGLGLSAWIMGLIPGLSIVLLPTIVVGGVALVNDVEKEEGLIAVSPA